MISNLRRGLLPALTLAAAIAAAPLDAQTISLTDNESPTAPFGKGANATTTYGQTFTAPAGFGYLQKFSFWLSDDPGLLVMNPTSLLFQAYVMQWDAVNGFATGPVLFTSNVRSGPASISQRYDFAATNVALDPSLQYVAFLSASSQLGNIAETDAMAAMETSFFGTYTGGQFVYTNNGADFSLLSSAPWEFTGLTEYQSRFEANFTDAAVSVVPEPSSFALFAIGFGALVVMARRKRFI